MKNFSLNAKFFFALSVPLIACAAVALTGISSMRDLGMRLEYIVDVAAKRLVLAKTMDSQTNQIRNFEKVYILEESADGMDSVGARLDKVASELEKNIEAYEKLAGAEGQRFAGEMRQRLAAWKPISAELRSLARAGKTQEATVIARGRSRDAMIAFSEVLDRVLVEDTRFLEEESSRAQSEYQAGRNFLVGLTAIAGLIAVVLAFLILRALSRAITGIVTDLGRGSEVVHSASGELSQAAHSLSSATSEAAASLEETVSSLEELSSMISRNAEHCQQASEISQSARQASHTGAQKIKDLIASVDRIAQSSRKIEEIINVIEDIAFQTNLLALNAAVEAARAGDQGKGFAVVAEAVRALAQRSGEAAKQITTMIKASVGEANSGVRQAAESEKALVAIMEQVERVSSLMGEINTASQEQSIGVQQISKAMNQMDEATQRNAATAEEAASASKELSTQATSLSQVVVQLRSVIFGGASHPGASPAEPPSSHLKLVTEAGSYSRSRGRLAPATEGGGHAVTGVDAAGGF